ncbi:MAG: ergothioneine biosynthesis protein EgtB [bacterium]|nr:ergothioneine biosynthesis protein EgtB [bacterium]
MSLKTTAPQGDETILADSSNSQLARRFQQVRERSKLITQPLTPEDCVIQSMPDVSPMRWHLAHTSWFFETFLLSSNTDYQPFNERFEYLFNSYYNTVGQQFPRHQRGLLSRPGLSEIMDYRSHVDANVHRWLTSQGLSADELKVLEIGLQHEQQHQELMLTDIKHILACNPLFPAYQLPNEQPAAVASSADLQWRSFPSELTEFGYAGDDFAFDNERPRHKAYLHEFQLATRCVTNGEYLEFMLDDGYRRPELWLSLGWSAANQAAWSGPLYWIERDGQWHEFTLEGLRPLRLEEPVCHVSYFEADAFARWSGCRLPTEFEWERGSDNKSLNTAGVFFDHLLQAKQPIHPQTETSPPTHLMGNVWQWTSSSYAAYPGYQAEAGALGEYNGKFMCNQYVLRGGSCATSSDHIRPTYRNFFPPDARWQFSGIRLAR